MANKVTDAGGATINLVEVATGYSVCTFDREPEDERNMVLKLKEFQCRDDDIYILAPIKSGTHWIWEICSMLINGKADTIPKSKANQMLEHERQETLDVIPSPRILNSHLSFRFLPEQLLQKKCRIIHIVRNPKDVLVSLYNHDTGVKCYGYNGKWENFLHLFLEDKLEYGSWAQYIKEWEMFRKDNPDYPLFYTSYEQLHKNYLQEIRNLANFLKLKPTEELIDAIAEKCRFERMIVDKEYTKEKRKEIFNGPFTMYRKGEIGDWKNLFTVAQNEVFDNVMTEKMKDISHTFQYSR